MADDVLRYKRLDGAVDALRQVAAANFTDGRQTDNLRPVLESVPPTLVIWGKDDEILPSRHAADLPDAITVEILPDTGHMPQMERSEEVNSKIRTFLTR